MSLLLCPVGFRHAEILHPRPGKTVQRPWTSPPWGGFCLITTLRPSFACFWKNPGSGPIRQRKRGRSFEVPVPILLSPAAFPLPRGSVFPSTPVWLSRLSSLCITGVLATVSTLKSHWHSISRPRHQQLTGSRIPFCSAL